VSFFDPNPNEGKLANLENFHLLEEKIAQTVNRIAELKAQNLALLSVNEELKETIKNLRVHGNELTEEIDKLKTAEGRQSEELIDQEEIKKRIERVLEKLGELQI
jgi:chromosome segregation ATPase